MARAKSMRRVSRRVSAPVCECRTGTGIFGLILLAVGIYALVAGFIYQFNNPRIAWNLVSALYYLVGVSLMVVGKIMSRTAHASCKVHRY